MCLSSVKSKPQHAFLAFASQLLSVELNTASPFWKVKIAVASGKREIALTSGRTSMILLPEFLTVALMRECKNCIVFCRNEIASPKLH